MDKHHRENLEGLRDTLRSTAADNKSTIVRPKDAPRYADAIQHAIDDAAQQAIDEAFDKDVQSNQETSYTTNNGTMVKHA